MSYRIGKKAITIATCLILGACRDSAPRIASHDDMGLHWAPLHWSDETTNGRTSHMALYVPISLEGLAGEFLLQLDTGAGWPILYGTPYRQLLRQAHRSDALGEDAVVDGRVGAYAFQGETLEVRRDFGDSLTGHETAAVVGTLGLHFLRHRFLVLDYPRQRFAVVDSQAGLPASLTARAKWMSIRYSRGYIYVPLVIDGVARDDIIYDTGASMFPVSLDSVLWKRLTARTPSDPANAVSRGMTWGKQMLFIGAPVQADIRLGDLTVDGRPMVYMSTPDTAAGNHESPPTLPFSGLVGNALLGDRVTLIIDLPNRRLGVVADSARR